MPSTLVSELQCYVKMFEQVKHILDTMSRDRFYRAVPLFFVSVVSYLPGKIPE